MKVAKARISDEAFKVTIGVFFAIAVVAATARMIIRLRLHKKLRLDDFCVIFACVCLAGVTGLSYYAMSLNYVIEQLLMKPTQSFGGGIDQAMLLQCVISLQKIVWAYSVLSWTVIFATKFGYLCLFRNLVDRIPSMYAVWKFVVLLTMLAFGFTLCSIWLFCPNDSLAGSRCLSPTGQYSRALTLTYVTILSDIVTDLFILMIPIYLIWLLRAKARQKFELAIFLCLSIVMIILAIVRIAGVRYHNSNDLSWNHFWWHLESCTAVTMLSATAFRSLFISAAPKGNGASPWVPSTGRLLGRHKCNVFNHQDLDDITVPSPTLTSGSRILDGRVATQFGDGTLTLESEHLRSKDQETSMQV